VYAQDISKVVEILNTNNLLFRPHFYSLFVKFSTELKSTQVDKLNAQVVAIASNANISYSRVDENGHTGKIVVDRFDDYNTLRSSTGDITFYKFNRTKAQARGTTEGGNGVSSGGGAVTGGGNSEGWKTVNNRTPRPQRTEGEARPQRAPRTEGDTRPQRAPRTQRTEGDTRPQRAPRTQRTEGDARPQRAPRTEGDATYTNSKPPRQSAPNSWAGRTGARGAPPTSS
jgi:hypothetical protein